MTEEGKNSEQESNNQTNPPTPPPTDNSVGKEADSNGSGQDAPKENYAGFNLPQPFIIKEDKENKGWFKRRTWGEITSAIAVIISVYAVTLNKCSLDNTTRALAISDSTFKRNNFKDSFLRISQIRRDSLDSIQRARDYTRDTTNIKISGKSLQAQIHTIEEAQKEFTVLNRPIIGLANFNIVSFEKNKNPRITFDIVNAGKYPALIISTKNHIGFGDKTAIDSLKEGIYTIYTVNETATANINYVPSDIRGNIPLPEEIYEGVISKIIKYYFAYFIKYKNLANGKVSYQNFIYEIYPAEPINIVLKDANENKW